MAVETESSVTIMDGSMGRQLCLDGMPQDDLFRQIWSARALVDESLHGLVVDAHRSYIEAGATLLITNAYGVQPTFYRRAFPDDWEANMLRDAELASRLAVRAREESGAPKVRIFGCLPPLSESHRPDTFATLLAEEGKEFVVQTFRNLAKASLKGGSDALMLENMVSWQEAQLALEAVKDLGVSLIVSMEGALRDVERVPHPETAPEIAKLVIKAKREGAAIEALGFSCTEPETILDSLKALESTPGVHQALQEVNIKLSAHANVNDRKQAHLAGFDVRSDKSKAIQARGDLVLDGFSGYAKFCKAFVAHGATYVGGCCGCGPAGISAVRDACIAGQKDGTRSLNDAMGASAAAVSFAVAMSLAPTGVLRVGINKANTLLVKRHVNARVCEGVVPSVAAELARCLAVDVRYIPFTSPGELADAVDANTWDVAFLAADSTRASTISFSSPYVEIPASYVVAQKSGILNISEVDKDGVRIAVFAGTAYDNWLTKHIKHATIVRASSRAGAVELVRTEDSHVLAGVREHLLEDVGKLPGALVLDGFFTSVTQAIGTKQGLAEEVTNFLNTFVGELISTGRLQEIVERENASGKLVVATPPIDTISGAKRIRTQ
eukprot:TRINITY_DN50105_c0_g1_i1.p1 TRINITY_DN50105_c0_g1~~TRINITY_DN50105_c0_g1_i1.p1  ORF type:complete len:611 (-),score=108.02 TRINITY_DN50105_c0_g1_i1:75-1907(-)